MPSLDWVCRCPERDVEPFINVDGTDRKMSLTVTRTGKVARKGQSQAFCTINSITYAVAGFGSCQYVRGSRHVHPPTRVGVERSALFENRIPSPRNTHTRRPVQLFSDLTMPPERTAALRATQGFYRRAADPNLAFRFEPKFLRKTAVFRDGTNLT